MRRNKCRSKPCVQAGITRHHPHLEHIAPNVALDAISANHQLCLNALLRARLSSCSVIKGQQHIAIFCVL